MDKTQKNPSPRTQRSYMTPLTWIIIIAAVAAFLLVKRLNQVKPETARAWLDKGALVIDVRSEAEYEERHLPNAINIPLNRLGDEIGRYAPNKEQPLLLHCLSGTRSGMGTGTLKRMGYLNVRNLGSYGRAERILGTRANGGTWQNRAQGLIDKAQALIKDNQFQAALGTLIWVLVQSALSAA